MSPYTVEGTHDLLMPWGLETVDVVATVDDERNVDIVSVRTTVDDRPISVTPEQHAELEAKALEWHDEAWDDGRSYFDHERAAAREGWCP